MERGGAVKKKKKNCIIVDPDLYFGPYPFIS